MTEPTRYNVTGEILAVRPYGVNPPYTVSYKIMVNQDVLADNEDAAADVVLRNQLETGHSFYCEWIDGPVVRERGE